MKNQIDIKQVLPIRLFQGLNSDDDETDLTHESPDFRNIDIIGKGTKIKSRCGWTRKATLAPVTGGGLWVCNVSDLPGNLLVVQDPETLKEYGMGMHVEEDGWKYWETVATGTADSATSTTLTDADSSFTTTYNSDYIIEITGGTGKGQIRTIASSTLAVVTIDDADPFIITPDSTSTYAVKYQPEAKEIEGANIVRDNHFCIVPFQKRTFIASQHNRPYIWKRGVLRFAGINAPPTALTVGAQPAGLLEGVYTYKFTVCNSLQEDVYLESPPSPESGIIALAQQPSTLPVIHTGHVYEKAIISNVGYLALNYYYEGNDAFVVGESVTVSGMTQTTANPVDFNGVHTLLAVTQGIDSFQHYYTILSFALTGADTDYNGYTWIHDSNGIVQTTPSATVANESVVLTGFDISYLHTTLEPYTHLRVYRKRDTWDKYYLVSTHAKGDIKVNVVTHKQIANNVAILTLKCPVLSEVGDSVIVAGVDATFNGTYTLTAVSDFSYFGEGTISYAKTAANVSFADTTGTVNNIVDNITDTVVLANNIALLPDKSVPCGYGIISPCGGRMASTSSACYDSENDKDVVCDVTLASKKVFVWGKTPQRCWEGKQIIFGDDAISYYIAYVVTDASNPDENDYCIYLTTAYEGTTDTNLSFKIFENTARVWFSYNDYSNVEYTHPLYYLDVNPGDGDEITGLVPFQGRYLVSKKRSLYLVVGGDFADPLDEMQIPLVNFDYRRLPVQIGNVSPKTLHVDHNGNAWGFAGAGGIWMYDGITLTRFTDKRISEFLTTLDVTKFSEASGGFDPQDNRYYVGHLTVTGSTDYDIMLWVDPVLGVCGIYDKITVPVMALLSSQ